MRKRKYSALSSCNPSFDCLTKEIQYHASNAFFERMKHAQNACNTYTLNLLHNLSHSHRDDDPVTKTLDNQPQAQIHNIVGTSKIDTNSNSFDLEIISRLLPNCTYDKQKFAAITIRLHDPFCTVLLFTSGKMVLTGCRSFVECCWASQNVVNILRLALPQHAFNVTEVTIQNIVGNVDLKLTKSQNINLERMYRDKSVFCTFQKNMFPGLIYRANNCPVVLLLFHSGKVVITGGKSVDDIFNGWNMLWTHVKQYIENN